MRVPAVVIGLLTLLAQPASCLKVAVFAPDDAEPTCLKAIEKVLRDAGVPFDEVRGKDVVDKAIVGRYDVLILPGGAYSERVVRHPRFIEGLKEFARAGGKIVGICAGAITLVEGGLVRAKVKEAGLGVGKVTLELRRHRLTEGLPNRLEVTYINGPVMRSQGAEVVARYAGGVVGHGDAILVDRYGKGEVIAIGPHPCHDDKGNVNPEGAKLLLNALGVKKQVKSGKVGGESWLPTPISISVVVVVLGAVLGVLGLPFSRRGTGS
ncbi:DJ-1/PfpI family protein [Methanopyrus sp.]